MGQAVKTVVVPRERIHSAKNAIIIRNRKTKIPRDFILFLNKIASPIVLCTVQNSILEY